MARKQGSPVRIHLRKHACEEPAVVVLVVQPPRDFRADVVVVTGKVESGGFGSLGRRNERLCVSKCGRYDSVVPSGGGKTKP
jgi:hypothetical protein